MNQLNVAMAVIAATILAIGLVSQAIKKTPLQEPLVAVLVGIAAGPAVAAWLDVGGWGDELRIMEEAARLTLAVALMAVALRLSRSDLKRFWRPAALLITLGMVGMWAAATALVWWILPVPLWLAALIGAAITPTDPVVASAIVTGPFAKSHLPERVRATLSLESGANDGLAYLIVMLPILLHHAPADAWSRWLSESVLVGVVVAVAIGAALGIAAARLLHWARQRNLIESYSYLSFTVALSLFTLGAAALVRSDALISVFVAGLAFDFFADTGEKHEEESVQETISKLFTLPMFVIFGAALPWADWARLGWPLLALAVLVLLARRIPVVGLLAPALAPIGRRDAAFLAWFGPIGVAAVYYATFAVRHTGEHLIWHAVSAVVLSSIIAHGVSAAPLTRLYAGRERQER
jgi:NhaP-type Na+/H+ or K+/H+ antiporter